MAVNSAPPNIKYNACGLPINPEKRESPYFVSDAETDRRKREAATATATEAATAPGAIRDGAGDGATGRD